MNSLEDRLRAATHAAAGTVAEGSAAPLRLPEPGSRVRLPGPRGRAMTWLAPIAAAAAVAAVVATGVAVRGDANLGNRPNPAQSASRLSHVAPRYFVALAHGGQARTQIRTADAAVGSTATGRIIARVAVPKPYNAFVAVSGARDDRTFVLAAQELPAPPAARGQSC